MHVDIKITKPKLLPGYRQKIKTMAEHMMNKLELHQAQLSILLCDDKIIQALNKQYRATNASTDVLAFPMQENRHALHQPKPYILGDIVISLETAKRQAKQQRKPMIDEVIFLFVHGLLHLMGYDHIEKKEEEKMMFLHQQLTDDWSKRQKKAGP